MDFFLNYCEIFLGDTKNINSGMREILGPSCQNWILGCLQLSNTL